MNKKYLAAIDVGTTGVKSIIFDLSGNVVSNSYEEYSCTYPKAGWVEQDCEMLINAVYKTNKEAIAKSGINVNEICSIAVSTQRSSTIFMDENKKPLKMISWLDNRAVEEADEIASVIGREKFYEITGLPLCATWMLPKILHTRKFDEELFGKTRKIIQLQDYILLSLGVDGYYSDEAEACFFGVWDNRKYEYNKEILSKFNLDESLFPTVKEAGTVVGEITSASSKLTGFAVGTPICMGLGDQNSAALGAGIVNVGDVSISIGTGGLATYLMDSAYRDKGCQTMVTGHANHGKWTVEGLQNAAAGAFRWFRDEVCAYEKHSANENGENVYEILNKMVENTPVGSKGLIMMPYFAGSAAPRWNAEARGSFIGLTFAHGKAEMARACMEGITLEQKDIMMNISKTANIMPKKIRIVGGATHSEVWNQIQTDIYGVTCETLLVADAASLGAAICAGVGVGVFASFDEGAYKMVHVKKSYKPNMENVAKYDELYNIFTDIYSALDNADINKKLSKF